ncbi:MAG: 7-carboxy-7-deazaguanine synthase QueE [Alphaproteobacteria bacterium]|nr:7-carboxy-7-deazaguanine synthase QueE [Alphaproteobacteria bacterium]
MSEEQTIRISEIFGPTIQGEGAMIGRPTVFVRTGGCDYRCAWCDTAHAVDSEFRGEWKAMSTEEIWAQVQLLSGGKPLTVSLSGGNPAIQPFGALIALGKKEGYDFALETQGSIAQKWFAQLDVLTLSPKAPSSGETTDWRKVGHCIDAAKEGPDIAMKIVIFNDEDYLYARQAAERYPFLPLYLQPGNDINQPVSNDRMLWLTEKALNDKWFDITILPQLHVMLWGNKRGV